MPESEPRQRLSLWGILSLLILGGIAYFFVARGDLLFLYELAIVALSLFLVIVAFDIGLSDREGGNRNSW
ncbi:MAG: hypothetical protein N0A16_04950 [Blastocatellia bacterium]|nr:hypothetical protein [Blastocatellia bacterium]MCS7157060.1 hypothetical protein [Blastocatellia bacterium]MCX7752261.1 hypothetical protein [Blastocatellia bacterium]MDW8167753.1 hypothetical protein [Acidobacteriota bacterium]MDW8256779.1 hypothetical protein [Acidobacteriota bacterium]